MPSVSAIVLTKNSERTIETCVKALIPAVDHVIVVDTGSSDNTVQIAKDSGARVYHFEWRDDFAAARNFGDSLATSDWVIHVDSDEILRSDDHSKIRKMCATLKRTDIPVIIKINQINVLSDNMQVEPLPRFYKRGTFHWSGIIHEQPESRRRDAKYGVVDSDIGVIHDGYNSDVIDVIGKARRNIRLLEQVLKEDPDNAMSRFFIGRDHAFIGEFDVAIPHLERALVLMEEQQMDPMLDLGYKVLLHCLEKIGDFEAAEVLSHKMSSKFPQYQEGRYKETTL